jgi:siroheme synthase
MINDTPSASREDEAVSHFPDPLPFRLNGFLGIVWASSHARDSWAPVLSRIRGVIRDVQWRSIASGARSCALITGEDAEDLPSRDELASHGLSWCELTGSGMSASRYWHTEAAVQRVPRQHGILIADGPRMRDFEAAWQARDYDSADRMLGVPACCAKAYRELCGDGNVLDPTWPYARRSSPDAAVDTITVSASDARVTTTNTLWRWIGIRAVPYFPCSYGCPATADLALMLGRTAKEAGSGRVWDYLTNVLSWPSEWTALHGIAEVKTPILKFRTATDATASKYTVRWDGSSYPQEGATGLGFPYRGASASRERRIMLPLIANDNVRSMTAQPGNESGQTPEPGKRTLASPEKRPVMPASSAAPPSPESHRATDSVAVSAHEGIVIVGSGIMVPDQLTLQALRILTKASEVWTNVPEPEHAELAKTIGRYPHSLWPFFQSDRPRIVNYEAIVAHLLQRASAVRQVAYLTQGHPMVLDRVATELLRQSSNGGVPVSVIPGVSSVDTILADIRYEPARGLQVFDATNFVRRGMKIDGRAGLLLLQPGVFGIDMPRLTSDAPAPQLTELRDALCTTYPEEHPAVLVRSATARMPKQRFQTTVRELDRVPAEALAASTLWIPPLGFGRRQPDGQPEKQQSTVPA